LLYLIVAAAAAAVGAVPQSEEELQQLAEASTVARVTKGIETAGGEGLNGYRGSAHG
jgi:hypothetical protein